MTEKDPLEEFEKTKDIDTWELPKGFLIYKHFSPGWGYKVFIEKDLAFALQEVSHTGGFEDVFPPSVRLMIKDKEGNSYKFDIRDVEDSKDLEYLEMKAQNTLARDGANIIWALKIRNTELSDLIKQTKYPNPIEVAEDMKEKADSDYAFFIQEHGSDKSLKGLSTLFRYENLTPDEMKEMEGFFKI